MTDLGNIWWFVLPGGRGPYSCIIWLGGSVGSEVADEAIHSGKSLEHYGQQNRAVAAGAEELHPDCDLHGVRFILAASVC